MQIPKRTKDTDISQDIIRGRAFKKQVLELGKEIGAAYAKSPVKSLNERIAEASKLNGFNRVQIQALVEETNTQAYLALYAKMRELSERDVRFPLAELGYVLAEMGADVPEEVVNPNRVTGKPGDGELKKIASTQDVNMRIGEVFEKIASAVNAPAVTKTELRRAEIERDSTIFKIAHTLVTTERKHGNSNEVFNTMIKEASWSDASVDRLIKKASEISHTFHKKGQLTKDRMVNLKVNPSEKVANHLLGRLSLIDKVASGDHVKTIPVNGIDGIDSFDALMKAAKAVESHERWLDENKK